MLTTLITTINIHCGKLKGKIMTLSRC